MLARQLMGQRIHISTDEDFQPRYDDLDKDRERLTAHITDLYHADRLGTTIAGMRQALDQAYSALEEAYFANALFALIERQHIALVAYWTDGPGPDTERTLARLVHAGQGHRVIRIWRAYLSVQKADFWAAIDTRRKELRRISTSQESNDRQRRAYEEALGQIPARKAKLLAVMESCRLLFTRLGANAAQMSRLAAEYAEVVAEERERPPGPPDTRQMDADVFWEIIGAPGEAGAQEQIEAITRRLARFKASAIKAFDRHLHLLDREAYSTAVWALAYLMRGGCSDDDFEAFRCWLVLQGRAVFEGALHDTDRFDVALYQDWAGSEALRDAPLYAYEMRSGTGLTRPRAKPLRLAGPPLDETQFADLLPRVAAATGHD